MNYLLAKRIFCLGAMMLVMIVARGDEQGNGSAGRSVWTGEDALGRSVTIALPVQRVVALSSATVEILFALEAGERLVGRSEWAVWPESVQSVPDVGSMARPNLAVLLRQQPDLVLVPQMAADRLLLDKLQGLGIASVVVAESSLADLQYNIECLGVWLGEEEAAQRLQRKIEMSLPSGDVDVGKRGEVPAVLLSYGIDVPYSANGSTWVGELLSRAGSYNICRDLPSAWPRVSLAFILQSNPDWVFFAPSSPEEAQLMEARVVDLAEHDFWGKLSAVQQGQVQVLSPSIWHIPGPRMVQAAAELREIVGQR